ncbi:MAG TPA: PorV/PorQ family protein [bacterium]|nr:PorV/PorQ family protein [bacterium]
MFFFLGCLFSAGMAPRSGFSLSGPSNSIDNLNSSARSGAMGSASVGAADDASALFSNPAGLAFLRQGEALMNSNFWLVDTFQETGLLNIPAIPGWGGLGFAGSFLNYGTFEGRDEAGSLAPNYSADNLFLKAGWGYAVLENLSLGMALQGSQTGLAGNTYWNLGLEFGALMKLSEALRVGADWDDIGLNQASETAGTAFHLGASVEAPIDSANRLLTAVSGAFEAGAVSYLQMGLEYGLQESFFLRAGYQAALGDNEIGGLTGLTAGVGFKLSELRLDYAYLPYGELGASHEISLGYQFGTNAPAEEAFAQPKAIPTVPPAGASQTGPPQAENPPAAKDPLNLEFDLPSDSTLAGKELEKQGKYPEAIQSYQQSLQEDPQDTTAWMALGDLYLRLSQKEKAIPCFQQVILLEPENQKLSDWLKQNQAVP